MIEFFFVNFTHAFTLFGRYLVLIACFSARGYTDDNRMAYGFLTGFFLSLSIRKFLYINYSIFEFIELRNVDSEQVENLYSHHWFPILRLSSWSIYIHTNTHSIWFASIKWCRVLVSQNERVYIQWSWWQSISSLFMGKKIVKGCRSDILWLCSYEHIKLLQHTTTFLIFQSQ